MSSNTKVCKKCGQDKPIAAFGNYKASKDGLRPWCRECMSALGKAYYERNREVKAAKCKAWREQNREHVVEYQQQYYQTKGRFLRRKRYLVDKENHRALAYKWRKEHPEAVKASRQRFLDSHREYLHEYEAKRWREQRDLLSARNKEWRDSHPIQRAQNEAKRRAKLKGVDVDPRQLAGEVNAVLSGGDIVDSLPDHEAAYRVVRFMEENQPWESPSLVSGLGDLIRDSPEAVDTETLHDYRASALGLIAHALYAGKLADAKIEDTYAPRRME